MSKQPAATLTDIRREITEACQSVTPAKAGVYRCAEKMDSRVRGNDGLLGTLLKGNLATYIKPSKDRSRR